MGNNASSPEKKKSSGSSSRRDSKEDATKEETPAEKMKIYADSLQQSFQKGIKTLDESKLFDNMCGPLFDSAAGDEKLRASRSYYSEDMSEDSRTISEDDTTLEHDRRRKGRSTESGSVFSQSDYESEEASAVKKASHSFESEDDSFAAGRKKASKSEKAPSTSLAKPLASSFAKRCYFTKAGIGKTTQHYEGLTLTGNVVLMLAAAMKLKGCPTICDEDLRRVEQTYPNQFSRLPDELLLSSGWRRISKYCHFSNKPIPDGVPFFHSKQRVHPSKGYYFLLAAAVGMIRPIDVEPLTRDTLILLETDYPNACDAAPTQLIQEPNEWVLVDKFCFFSGGPINTEEDVYYMADFDGNPIYMLAFLSPSLTPEELYKLGTDRTDEPGLKSVAAVEEVESVYDLTERDFDDLKLYHLGPCRALPPYMLQPQAWTKVLPPHFLAAKHRAIIRAQLWEEAHGGVPVHMGPQDEKDEFIPADSQHAEYLYAQGSTSPVIDPPDEGATYGYTPSSVTSSMGMAPGPGIVSASPADYYQSEDGMPLHGVPPEGQYYQDPSPQGPFPPQGPPHALDEAYSYYQAHQPAPPPPPPTQHPHQLDPQSFQRDVEEDGAFVDSSVPIDEAIAHHQMNRYPISPPGYRPAESASKMDPPDDEPPSLSRDDIPDDEKFQHSPVYYPGMHEESVDPRSIDPEGAGYYDRDGEYYDSPDKNYLSQQDDYYPREGEYYESPDPHYRNESHNGEYYHQHEEKNAFSPGAVSSDQDAEYFRSPDENDPPENPGSPESFVDRDGALSPKSDGSRATEVSHSSAALRTAHDYLKKTRQKRMESNERRTTGAQAGDDDRSHLADWESSSEMGTSVVSGSSVWTDSSNPADRSSRRALILQMAKARMRQHKSGMSVATENRTTTITEETQDSQQGITLARRSEPLTTDIDLRGEID